MYALTRAAIIPREIGGLHGQSGLAESAPRNADYVPWRRQFSEIGRQALGTVPQNAADLTDRECTILQLLSLGFSNKEAAKRLGISPETVKSHIKNIFQKLCVDRRAQAVSRALGMGVITAG